MATCDINALKAAAVANRFDRMSSQKAGALELQFWYAIGGSTKTVSQLKEEACAGGFTCVTGRAALAAKLQLLCNASGGVAPSPPSPPCVSLIPGTAMYGDTSNYSIGLAPNTAYKIFFGVNDNVLYVPGGIPVYSYAPGTFQFTTGPSGVAYLTGNNSNVRVTAIICAVAASLTFISVTPSTASAFAQNYDGVISGTGFTLSGINLMKVDNGAGSSFNFTTMTISNDTTINVELAGAQMTPPGVYTIYYSKDAGATWTTTGLTITSS